MNTRCNSHVTKQIKDASLLKWPMHSMILSPFHCTRPRNSFQSHIDEASLPHPIIVTSPNKGKVSPVSSTTTPIQGLTGMLRWRGISWSISSIHSTYCSFSRSLGNHTIFSKWLPSETHSVIYAPSNKPDQLYIGSLKTIISKLKYYIRGRGYLYSTPIYILRQDHYTLPL